MVRISIKGEGEEEGQLQFHIIPPLQLISPEAEFLDVTWEKSVKDFSSLQFKVTSSNGFYSPS